MTAPLALTHPLLTDALLAAAASPEPLHDPWAVATDVIAIGFTLFGLFFMAVAAIGIVRMPDVYHRLHAASKASTLGLLGLVLGAMFHVGTIEVSVKGLLTVVFAFVATPVGSHMLAKASLKAGAARWEGTIDDERPSDDAE